MTDDQRVLARVAREIGARSTAWPAWLRQLDEIEVLAAQQAIEPLREGTHLIVHARLAGIDVTAVVSIDFLNGAAVADAFFSSEPLEAFNASWIEHRPPGDETTLELLTLADARAQIEEAVEMSARLWPPLESESWPASRPLLTWLARRLPGGGTGFVRPTGPTLTGTPCSTGSRPTRSERVGLADDGSSRPGADRADPCGGRRAPG